MRTLLPLAFAILSSLPPVARAEPGGPLLKGKAVTEANILDALAPGAPAADANGDVDTSVATRSIQVSRATRSTPAAPRPRGSASLLITFETGSTRLTGASKDQLDVVATALGNDRLKDFRFQVDGHADARGRPDQNLALSAQRAQSVRSYLIDIKGVAAERLVAVGRGDADPMNLKDVAAPENRRVTITTMGQ